MAKGYWIVHVTVTDAENYPQYVAAKLRQAYSQSEIVIVEGQE